MRDMFEMGVRDGRKIDKNLNLIKKQQINKFLNSPLISRSTCQNELVLLQDLN